MLYTIIKEFDRILHARYGVPHIVSTFAVVESNMRAEAKRVEPAFYKRYMQGKPHWEKYVKEYGNLAYSSLGIFQIMFTTAIMYDKKITPNQLLDPYVNTFLAFLIIDKNISDYGINNQAEWVQAYNGGKARNDSTKHYLNKWQKVWLTLNKGTE